MVHAHRTTAFEACLFRLAAALLLFAAAGTALAQADNPPYPSKSIRLMVPSAAGGGLDLVARVIGPKLAERLGQAVVIENRPGASGAIAAALVAKSAPDGYTLLLADNGILAINPHLYQLGYDPVNDLVPVAIVTRVDLLLVVNPAVAPVATVAELVALAKSSPKGIDFGSPGAGTPHRLAMELLAMRTTAAFTAIPYSGSAPAVPDLLAGRIAVMYMTAAAAIPHLKGGRLRAIATSGPRRMDGLPDVPTIAESGVPGYEVSAWQAVAMPAGVPPSVTHQLASQLAAVLADPAVKKQLVDAGYEIVGSTPQEAMQRVKDESAQWRDVISKNKITVQ